MAHKTVDSGLALFLAMMSLAMGLVCGFYFGHTKAAWDGAIEIIRLQTENELLRDETAGKARRTR